MANETTVLISNITTEATDSSFTYSDKAKGAGYHKKGDGVHTAVYDVNSFSGTIKFQGSLADYPGDTDWFDIDNTELGGDSTIFDGDGLGQYITSRTFTGKFVWIRAAYNLQNGIINSIRFFH
jgi:hypothetical protein